jgi:hypothetical protein
MKGLTMLGALLLAGVTSAQTDTWVQEKSPDGTISYAAVTNADGQLFGEVCYYATKNCFWQLSVETPCEVNGTAPVLVNTDGGTAALTVKCVGVATNGRYHRYQFSWKELEAALQGSRTMGIAMGLQANGFRVYRFNLDGMLAAQQKLETQFFAAVPSSKQPSARPASETL